MPINCPSGGNTATHAVSSRLAICAFGDLASPAQGIKLILRAVAASAPAQVPLPIGADDTQIYPCLSPWKANDVLLPMGTAGTGDACTLYMWALNNSNMVVESDEVDFNAGGSNPVDCCTSYQSSLQLASARGTDDAGA